MMDIPSFVGRRPSVGFNLVSKPRDPTPRESSDE